LLEINEHFIINEIDDVKRQIQPTPNPWESIQHPSGDHGDVPLSEGTKENPTNYWSVQTPVPETAKDSTKKQPTTNKNNKKIKKYLKKLK
jgi:hypothetical protein